MSLASIGMSLINSRLCGLGPAMASAFDIASQFFSRILVEVLKNVAIRAARSSFQLNTFGKGIQIVNQFGLTWPLIPVFLRSRPTTHAETFPKLNVLWCAFELDAVFWQNVSNYLRIRSR